MKGRMLARAVLVALVGITLLAVAVSAERPPSDKNTGTGRVFFPNPVATLQLQTLTDQNDADYAALQPAYHVVVLTNLDGSGFLRGDWANVRSETGNPAYSPDNNFIYNRHDDEFEQVMAYYWVTEAQKYIQSLGFGVTRRAINKESQDIRINQFGIDNSYSWDKHDVLRFGKGGVDDAEDADVILHEYGHAMLDSQSTPFGAFGASSQAGAIHEGFADYWAVTVTEHIVHTPDPACIADWDSVSYTTSVPHCLRRIDLNLHYPENLTGRVHSDGRIWSRALWDIRNALHNSAQADTIILESHFGFANDSTMPQAAQVIISTAQSLYGSSAANKVKTAFQARGILP